MIRPALSSPEAPLLGGPVRGQALGEMVLILGLFFLFAGCPPPDVNEAHYLAKAKHYWNPDWCAGDLFLESADAHLVFYWAYGWLTRWFSFAVVAWLGRLVTWGLLAWAWQRLSTTIVQTRYVSVLTAAWFLLLLDRFHLAGEWVIGGVEAKGFAYVLVLFGLRAIFVGQWRAVWLWFGSAAAFHVLVGGWSVVIAALVWLSLGSNRPQLRAILPALVLGFVCSLPGLVPALQLTAGVDAEHARQANEIYVFGRLGHHLAFHQFTGDRIVAFRLLVVVWLVISWRLTLGSRTSAKDASAKDASAKDASARGATRLDRRLTGGVTCGDRSTVECPSPWSLLSRFTAGAVLLAAAGWMLDGILRGQPGAAAWLLRFYWFRAADVMVPLAVAMAIPLLIADLKSGNRTWQLSVSALSILMPVCFFGTVFVSHQRDFRPRAEVQCRLTDRIGTQSAMADHRAWIEVCRWIDQRTSPDAKFLTPRGQQTFKWYAKRSEIASWKDIPQDAEGVIRWWRRIEDIYPVAVHEGGLGAWTDHQLLDICRRYQVDYILIDRSCTSRRLGFPRVYPNRSLSNASFELYEVPHE